MIVFKILLIGYLSVLTYQCALRLTSPSPELFFWQSLCPSHHYLWCKSLSYFDSYLLLLFSTAIVLLLLEERVLSVIFISATVSFKITALPLALVYTVAYFYPQNGKFIAVKSALRDASIATVFLMVGLTFNWGGLQELFQAIYGSIFQSSFGGLDPKVATWYSDHAYDDFNTLSRYYVSQLLTTYFYLPQDLNYLDLLNFDRYRLFERHLQILDTG